MLTQQHENSSMESIRFELKLGKNLKIDQKYKKCALKKCAISKTQ